MIKFLTTGKLTWSAFIAILILSIATPNIVWGKKTGDEVQPYAQKVVLPLAIVALRVIAVTMTIKVGEDVLVGWLAEKYGDTWEGVISRKTDIQLRYIASIASKELRAIMIDGQRISIEDFVREFK